MTTREFCYWLQGFFELIGEQIPTLSERRAQCIKNHLDLALKVDTADSPTRDYCVEMKAFLTWAGANPPTAMMCRKLNDLFSHAIDPSYPGDQQELNALHGETAMRC